MSYKNFLCVLASAIVMSGCGTQLKVAEVDGKTGLLKSEKGEVATATVVTAKRVSLKPFKGMVFASGSQFNIDQMKKIGYFDEVLDLDGLQKLIITEKLQDKVPSLNDKIGLNNLYRAYKPFLWVYFKRVTQNGKPYVQLVATNPDTLEDLFVSEVHIDFAWTGMTDQNSRYPLYNSLITWINQNKD